MKLSYFVTFNYNVLLIAIGFLKRAYVSKEGGEGVIGKIFENAIKLKI